MPHQHYNRSAARKPEPSADSAVVVDDLLIDDPFDDFLDRHVAAIRASLADCRYL